MQIRSKIKTSSNQSTANGHQTPKSKSTGTQTTQSHPNTQQLRLAVNPKSTIQNLKTRKNLPTKTSKPRIPRPKPTTKEPQYKTHGTQNHQLNHTQQVSNAKPTTHKTTLIPISTKDYSNPNKTLQTYTPKQRNGNKIHKSSPNTRKSKTTLITHQNTFNPTTKSI